MIPELPTEIWHHILKFADRNDLHSLLGINSLLFRFAMRCKYENIFIKDYGRKSLKLTRRLRDPFVGRFVRGIHLRLVYIKDDGHGFISSAHQRSFITTLQEYIPGILTEYPSEAIPAAFTTLRSALTGLANRTMSARNFDNLIGWGAPKPKGFNGPSTPGSFDRFVMALRDAFPGFVNLEVFCIDSWDVLDTYDLQPFWNAMWLSQLTPETRHLGLIPSPPTSSTLRRLSLGGSLYGYETFARSDIPHLVNLKELALEFTGSAVARIEKTDETQRILLDVVVPFIRKQAPQLEFLKIWSWALIELEDMFLKLNKLADDAKDCNASIFPRMHTFSVRMPFNKAFPQNASGLKDLLHRASPTIQHLELRLNPTGVAVDPTPDVLLGRWLHDIMISDRRPTELKTLQIYPTITPLGFEAVLKGIQASSATLKMVGIRDSYLQFDQVKQVIDALDPNTPILGLRLNVWRLTAALMDLFAGRLPNLQCISLYIGDTPIDDPNASLKTFRNEMANRSYPNWKLHDIGVWQGGFVLDEDTMSALSKCIPSVTSFWGTGEMDPDSECLS